MTPNSTANSTPASAAARGVCSALGVISSGAVFVMSGAAAGAQWIALHRNGTGTFEGSEIAMTRTPYRERYGRVERRGGITRPG